jgi:hypothetical protein
MTSVVTLDAAVLLLEHLCQRRVSLDDGDRIAALERLVGARYWTGVATASARGGEDKDKGNAQ